MNNEEQILKGLRELWKQNAKIIQLLEKEQPTEEEKALDKALGTSKAITEGVKPSLPTKSIVEDELSYQDAEALAQEIWGGHVVESNYPSKPLSIIEETRNKVNKILGK